MHIQQEANTCSLIIMSADLHHTSSFEPPSSGRVSAPLIKPMPMIARFHLVTRSGARLREVSTLSISQPRVCGVNEAAWSLSVVDKVKWCRLLSAYLLLRIASASSRSPHSFSPTARRSIRSKPCSYIVKSVSPLNTITTHRPLVSHPRPLYPLISLTHSHPLPPMTSFHRVTLPSAQATAKTFPARLHETLHTASGKSGSGLSDPWGRSLVDVQAEVGEGRKWIWTVRSCAGRAGTSHSDFDKNIHSHSKRLTCPHVAMYSPGSPILGAQATSRTQSLCAFKVVSISGLPFRSLYKRSSDD